MLSNPSLLIWILYMIHKELGEGATDKESQAYRRWEKADEMVWFYILAFLSNVLQHQHWSFATAYDIMLNLKDKFGDRDRAARQVEMKGLMNTIIAKGTRVRDHVLKIIGLLNELEILGAEIDGETQVDIVLQSLLDLFKGFRQNYNMNKLNYSLSELLKEFQAAEGLFGKLASALVAEKASTFMPKSKKGRRRMHKLQSHKEQCVQQSLNI